MKKIRFLAAATLASLALAASPAHAAAGLWDFTYSGNGVSASGSFETASQGSSAPSAVLSITGTYSDASITNGVIDGVVALGTDGGFYYDNAFGGTPLFSNPGLLFDVNGSQHVNIYSIGSDYYSVTYENGGIPNTPVTLTITAVPEPTSIALLLAGLGALGIASRRRTQRY